MHINICIKVHFKNTFSKGAVHYLVGSKLDIRQVGVMHNPNTAQHSSCGAMQSTTQPWGAMQSTIQHNLAM